MEGGNGNIHSIELTIAVGNSGGQSVLPTLCQGLYQTAPGCLPILPPVGENSASAHGSVVGVVLSEGQQLVVWYKQGLPQAVPVHHLVQLGMQHSQTCWTCVVKTCVQSNYNRVIIMCYSPVSSTTRPVLDSRKMAPKSKRLLFPN